VSLPSEVEKKYSSGTQGIQEYFSFSYSWIAIETFWNNLNYQEKTY